MSIRRKRARFGRAAMGVAAAAAVLGLAPCALAQTPAEESGPLELPSLNIGAGQETANGPVDGYVAGRSATATKTDTPINEVPQSITVITADQVQDQNSQTIQEVLRYTAGVRSEHYGLDNRGDWFTLRGASEGSVLLNGLRLPLTGWWGTMRNEPYAFERVEVLRGPSSVIAGQNGPGGVVNLVSKRPQAAPFGEVSVQFGNENHKQIAADMTGPLNGDSTLLGRLVLLGKDSGTQVDHADEQRILIAPTLTWLPAAGTSITLFAEYQKDQSKNVNAFFPIEGVLVPAPNGFIPMDTFIGEPDWDRYGGERVRLAYEVRHELNEAWTVRHDFRHDRVDGSLRTVYAAWWEGFVDETGAPDPNGTYLNRLWYANDDTSRVMNADLLLEGHVNWGRSAHTLLFGIDGMKNDADQRTWLEDYATPLDVYNPVYGTYPEPDWDNLPTDFAQTRVTAVGLLVQDQIKLDERWVFVAGVRYDTASTDTDTMFSDGSTNSGDQDDDAFSGNLGIVYLADGGWSPYASFSQSFEPVAETDAFGEAFKPKRGEQFELGVKWTPTPAVMATAAIYHLKEKNRLTTDPDNIDFSIQRGEVTVKGAEFEVMANLENWQVIANYTFMDARQTSLSELDEIYLGKQLEGIPQHSAAAWVVYRFAALGLPDLRAGLGVRYVGETNDGIDVTFTPSNTLLDAMVSYDIQRWRFALNVSNLTDERYIATCLERGDCWFGTRRKIALTAAYRW
jgi:iron complex outermembrane recepter protein